MAWWWFRGKLRTALLTTAADGADQLLVEGPTYVAQYRDYTECRDEQADWQLLARWERETEQINARTLAAGDLNTVRRRRRKG